MAVFLWFVFATAIVFEITCLSILYNKADKPSWGCIVPIYGIILLCDIAGKPRWWTVLCVIPFVNIIAYIILSIGVARNFERSDGFGLGLVLLPVIFYGILALGNSEYSPLEREETMLPGRASYASPVTRPQQEVTSASDSVGQRPKSAKCPFCRSRTFSVVGEAGSRRCSDCHSVLPSYVLGTD